MFPVAVEKLISNKVTTFTKQFDNYMRRAT